MSHWKELASELDSWREAGLTASFWWRDDDATRPGPLLDRLFEIARSTPLALAVIPALADVSLAERLSAHGRHCGRAVALQHGYAHVNHAPDGEKKAEFGDHRPLNVMLDELSEGRRRMQELFAELFMPVLTPPWNRAGESVKNALQRTGLQRLSGFGPRDPVRADREINTHIDIVDWHGGRGFIGESRALQWAVSCLSSRRAGNADRLEPIGLLTHHIEHDEDCWQFVGRFVQAIGSHPAAQWILP